ncbi:MAG: response regulator [Lachnospiraceae bacterium]|nr:response regulator [Lachnospiraceae bacterium]
MIQKKYLYKDLKTAEEESSLIRDILSETPHRAALITFYEVGFSAEEIEAYVQKIKSFGFPELLIAGISATLVAELMPEGTGILVNLILTDTADFEVVTLPCVPGEEDQAADRLHEKLESCENPIAVELFVSNMSLHTTRFMERALAGHEDVVLFGTSTIRNLPTKLSVEDSSQVVELEQGDPAFARDEFVFGNALLPDGFVAVIFSGENLKIQANYALGWSPIGRKLSPTLGERVSKGETVVTEINSLPAVDIYREYLGVFPDSYLISNICEFPFIVERDGINICLIPIDCGKYGELYFMMTLHPEEKLRFSFASHDEVLYASQRSLRSMEYFQPQALFLTLCGNRLNLLKEDAHLEWDGFNTVAPDYALMHGACELYYHRGKGGILNSAHLAVGFKEGSVPAEGASFIHPDVEKLRHGRSLPLSDRMSAFIRKITNELLDMASEANDANNAKSAFLSHMSHEIRTPINAILGMDEMILRESSEEEVLKYAGDIRSACNNLLGIVNDVLDFSKIEAGKMNIIPAEYELSSIINDLFNMVRLRADSKKLTIKLDIDPSIPSVLFGDETRIKQIITNILTNAVKYTEKGSVTLTIKQLEESGSFDPDTLGKACPGDSLPDTAVKLLVAVKDTGIGIRPEDMKKLFVQYERMEEKRNRTIEGTGLGLNITRELLELMGSSLSVESAYGEGSVFSFELLQGVINSEPVGELNGRFKKTTDYNYHVRFTAEDAHILVVDDTKVNLDVIRNLLKKTKITVDAAESGAEALELVQFNSYDLILLDHLMPEMDGPETLRRMNEMKDNQSAGVPVISLTANAMPGARDEYIKAGFKDYLAKPINSKQLEDMLFHYIPPEKIRTISDEEYVKKEEPSSLPSWLLNCPDINASEGLKNCGSGKTYLIVLKTFFETISEGADEIEDYYRREDWENYTVKVHALKSSARTIGATALSDLAAMLEKAGEDKDTEVIKAYTGKLLARYRSLLGEMV